MWSDPSGTRVSDRASADWACRGRGQPARRRRSARDGFSMIELLVVITILLVIAAAALPNLMQTLANVRLRSSVNTAAALLQQGRLRAVRDNTYYEVIADSNTADTNVLCLDLNKNGTCKASADKLDPQARLSGTSVLTTTSPPTSITSCTSCNIPAYPIEQKCGTSACNLGVYFNSRGMPCVPISNASSNTVCKIIDSSSHPISYIFYMTDQRPLYGWAAVTVSPAGRIRVWMYRGNGVWEQ